ncbi:MAG: prepilin-type N-terminal cleavage/methylation domain-containing protein [Candidatus Pacebacteria bacterium]|nr:prepilin-type N-terminal cleavage/methylation domain-containing protein [Candidatus Paceibacterota bacterium]
MKIKINLKKFYKLPAFTLLELIVVIAIISILATIAIPSFTSSIAKARIAAIKSDVTNLRKAMEIYYYSNGGKYNTGTFYITRACDNTSGNDNVFADPQVSKIILSLKNKLYPVADTIIPSLSSHSSYFYCGIGLNKDTYTMMIYNLDNYGTGLCFDSLGNYIEKPKAPFSSFTEAVQFFQTPPQMTCQGAQMSLVFS